MIHEYSYFNNCDNATITLFTDHHFIFTYSTKETAQVTMATRKRHSTKCESYSPKTSQKLKRKKKERKCKCPQLTSAEIQRKESFQSWTSREVV